MFTRSTFVLSLLIVAFVLVSPSQAQTCDPYRTRIPIDYRTYPTPETAAAFFATLDQGEPVEGHAPYVWRHDSQGWHWSCAVADTPVEPPYEWGTGELVAGRYYSNPYNQVALLSAKDAVIPGQPGRYNVFIFVYPHTYCGNLGWSFDAGALHNQVWREVAEVPIVPGCHPATTVFPEWADPRRAQAHEIR